MAQYAILNTSIVIYTTRKKMIQDMIAEMKALASKTDKPHEPEELLEESRRKISKQVRSTITGGDVLQIDDFQIDMNAVVKRKETKSPRKQKNKKQAALSKVVNAINQNSQREEKKHLSYAEIIKTLGKYS